MKRNLAIIFFSLMFFHPSEGTDAQISSNKAIIKNDNWIKKRKDNLFNEAFANQDTLTELLITSRLKKARIKKPVIKYVKVYKMVPIYVPAKDSVVYKKTFQKDTLQGNYYIDENFKNDPTQKKAKKKSFLWSIFHKKNKQVY